MIVFFAGYEGLFQTLDPTRASAHTGSVLTQVNDIDLATLGDSCAVVCVMTLLAGMLFLRNEIEKLDLVVESSDPGR